MKTIVAYLLVVALGDSVLLAFTNASAMPGWWMESSLPLSCALFGGVGGVVYCLRGIYLSGCVRQDWDDAWKPWYYIRPLVSHLCGTVSFVFLRTGLLVLESRHADQATDLGYLALAFIAGLNVDRFIGKVEDISHASWGIQKTRTATESDRDGD